MAPAGAAAGVPEQREALGPIAGAVEQTLAKLDADSAVERLWSEDASLWTGADEGRWLGWLQAPKEGGRLDAAVLSKLRATVAGGDFAHVAVLGMGGSSLCPDVLAHTFAGSLARRLHVFDSTVPDQVRAHAAALDLRRTLFVVSSKSGSTIEPNVLLAWVLEQLETAFGAERAGGRIVAVTDPGSELEKRARDRGFAAIAHGVPEIGGRFSALSAFGLVPAALAGLDVDDLIARARTMADRCATRSAADNPGVRLGAILGAAARAGRDKLTLVLSPGIATLGAWLEQLIAESTGKHGVGIVPIEGEAIAGPGGYGSDRLFVQVRLASGAGQADDPAQDTALEALEAAGEPVVRIDVADPAELSAEFFRWEVATAVAGAILGINPFDQPDVEAAKVAARRRMDDYEEALQENRALPRPKPLAEEDGIAVLGAPGIGFEGSGVRDALDALVGSLGSGDYFAINAYLARSPAVDGHFKKIREQVRASRHAATTLGYGPRFLHSTGQLHKGGPNTGVFLQVTAEAEEDVAIPDQNYSFGVLAAAQAEGDFAVLAERGRRALHLHLTGDVERGIAKLRDHIESQP